MQKGYRKYKREVFLKEKDFKKAQEKQFRGPPFGSLLKYKIGKRSRWTVGFTLENDPGESYFTRYQKNGFDFLSAHFMLTNKHWLQKIIIGDYKLQWGQGLSRLARFLSRKIRSFPEYRKIGERNRPLHLYR